MSDFWSGVGEGELSSVAEKETVEVITGDDRSLADSESTSDTLAYIMF